MEFLNLSSAVGNNSAPFVDYPSLIDEPIQFPFYHVHRDSVFPGIPDNVASLLINVLAYWVTSLFYHSFDISGWKWVERYRIQESEEVKKRNLVTKAEAIRMVAFQQVMQTAFGFAWFMMFPVPSVSTNYTQDLRLLSLKIAKCLFMILGEQRGREIFEQYGAGLTYSMYWWVYPIWQFVFGFLFLDTYQYFLHRALHEVKFLYKHFHSMHHRLYVPFAFGALYGHPFEGAILDGLGAGLAHTIAGMSERQAILLFGFATYKSCEDHCGYYFPWNPMHTIFGNNADYHDIHHQNAGIKSNYSQFLFNHWDVMLGTRMTREQLTAKTEKKEKST